MSSDSSISNRGRDLEVRVAHIFRALDAEVERDVSIAGSQIDVVVREKSSSGSIIKTAIECKAYQQPVGVDVVRNFIGLSYLLKQRNLIDRGAMVSTGGFTRAARDAAREYGIDLIEIADLEHRLSSFQAKTNSGRTFETNIAEPPPKKKRRPLAFVVMPFDPKFEDVFILGIREVAEKHNFVVERADSIEYNDDILQIIREKIRDCDVVIADTTGKNPNVFYEIGYAHGLNKQTILIGRKGETIPFDLMSKNHVLFDTIVELRDKLEKRIKGTLLG